MLPKLWVKDVPATSAGRASNAARSIPSARGTPGENRLRLNALPHGDAVQPVIPAANMPTLEAFQAMLMTAMSPVLERLSYLEGEDAIFSDAEMEENEFPLGPPEESAAPARRTRRSAADVLGNHGKGKKYKAGA